MKKKQTILLGLGAMTLLASCGSKEITDATKIDDLKYGIALRKDEIKNYDFVISFKETNVGKESKEEVETTNGSGHIRMNEDGEMQVYVVPEAGRKPEIIYLVKDETYEKVIYCEYEYYNNGRTTVIDSKGHKSEFASVYAELLGPFNSVISMLLDPFKCAFFNEYLHSNPDQKFETERKYFSDKDGQLTIKIDETSVIENDDAENHFEMEFEDYAFKRGSFIHTYSYDNYFKTMDYTFSLERKEKFSIELPNGWQNYLVSEE